MLAKIEIKLIFGRLGSDHNPLQPFDTLGRAARDDDSHRPPLLLGQRFVVHAKSQQNAFLQGLVRREAHGRAPARAKPSYTVDLDLA